jgi:CRP-like cAMP-binding protein
VTQASQLAVCTNYHPIEKRLCRFLSRTFDRVSGDDVAITQGRIGELLGVRRVSITEAAGRLQAAGIIECRRGRVRLLSRKKLDARACACGAIIQRAFEAVSGRPV